MGYHRQRPMWTPVCVSSKQPRSMRSRSSSPARLARLSTGSRAWLSKRQLPYPSGVVVGACTNWTTSGGNQAPDTDVDVQRRMGTLRAAARGVPRPGSVTPRVCVLTFFARSHRNAHTARADAPDPKTCSNPCYDAGHNRQWEETSAPIACSKPSRRRRGSTRKYHRIVHGSVGLGRRARSRSAHHA